LTRSFIRVWGQGSAPNVKELSRLLPNQVKEHLRGERCRLVAGTGSVWRRRGGRVAAGLVLLRHLADKTGLTSGLSRALASPRILHAAARLVRGRRKRRLKIQASWPWAEAIASAWQRIDTLPQAP
jgi:hypothetical protein